MRIGTISKKCTRLWLTAILTLWLISSTGCGLLASRQTVRVIPADRAIKKLPNGNYEVTSAWLLERYEYERHLTEELEKVKKGRK
ncbi:MAG: hypothetical protein RDU76_11540 [Candidatus Edwardsbacteria bacterium]|nr:hypothetical protein [Candidatus Edwardsbacteria bacterium]